MRAMPVCIGGNSPVSKKVLATTLSLPQKSILEKHGGRTHPRMDHAQASIENAAVQQIIAPESEGRPQRHIAPGGAPPLRRQISRAHPAVGDDFVELVPQI